jgi:2-polyprenyl-3-methyl-5-hydroxy-6-metoxy-1,4-benzoquinol methylase
MNSYNNPWDILGNKFNIYKKKNRIDTDVAENILIAWPTILDLITKEYPNPKGIKILDFGCGTGGFCNKLFGMGYDVVGLDSSVEMIKIARKNSPKKIPYIIGDQTNLLSLGKFNTIVSIMTFPFIENINMLLRLMTQALHQNGVLIFADFNIAWVKECLKIKVFFSDVDSNINPKKGWVVFGNNRIPVFLRNSNIYDELGKQNKLIKLIDESPPFTKDFIKQYPECQPNNISEYLILGYKKGKF